MKLNKKVIVITFIIIFIILTISSYLYYASKNGLSDGIYLSCDEENIILKNELNCSIFGVSKSYEVSALSGDIKLSNNLELLKIDIDSIWEGDGDDGKIILYTDSNKKGKFNIGKIKASIKENVDDYVSLSIENVEFFDEDFNAKQIDNDSIEIKINKGGNYES